MPYAAFCEMVVTEVIRLHLRILFSHLMQKQYRQTGLVALPMATGEVKILRLVVSQKTFNLHIKCCKETQVTFMNQSPLNT